MEPLTWSGDLGAFLNPVMLTAVVVFVAGFLANFVMTLIGIRAGDMVVNPDHTLSLRRTPIDYALMSMKYRGAVSVPAVLPPATSLAVCCSPSPETSGILGGMAARFTPRLDRAGDSFFAVSITFKRRLGLYGKLFDSLIGMIGFGLVMFWIFTAIFAAWWRPTADHRDLADA